MGKDHLRSVELYERAKQLIPGGVNSPVRAFRHVGGTPLYFERAAGSSFTDADGDTRVDFCMSWGPLILGHAHPAVVDSVCGAAKDGLSYGACHRKEIRLAELILSGLSEFQRVRLVSSGTEAVMTALRIARATTNRELVVKFSGGYHGHYDGLLVKAGSGLATLGTASSGGIPGGIAQTTIVAEFDDESQLSDIFRRYGDRIAAVILEPLPANDGLLPQRKEFLTAIRSLTREHGSMLIFDEVITGFRVRFGGYYQQLGICPDLVTLGKVIGGGMPIGAIVGPGNIMDKLSPVGNVYQAGTLSGNPVSLAAGIATLDLLQDGRLYDKLDRLGQLLEDELARSRVHNARIRRVGSIIWPYLAEGVFPLRPDAIAESAVKSFQAIYWSLVDCGYYLPPSSYEVLFLSGAHSDQEVSGLASCIAKSMRDAGLAVEG